MLISRTLARRRIAAGERPRLFAAWLPVLLDALAIVAFLALISPPLGHAAADAGVSSLPAIILFMFAVYFVPFQFVVILSTIWAVKSRWQDDPPRNET